MNAAPEEQWLTLLDKDGKDKNERGEATRRLVRPISTRNTSNTSRR